jgi:hypothetical protein
MAMSRSRGATSLTTRRRSQRAGSDRLEPGDHAQQRRLAAAGRADQHQQLAVGDLEVRVGDADVAVVVDLAQVIETDACHRSLVAAGSHAATRAAQCASVEDRRGAGIVCTSRAASATLQCNRFHPGISSISRNGADR